MISQKFSKFRIIMNYRSNSIAHIHMYIYMTKEQKIKLVNKIGNVKGKFEKTSVLSKLSRESKWTRR